MSSHKWWQWAVVLISLLANQAWSMSPAELQAAKRLEIDAKLFPADNIVPGQHVELGITIATDRWFTGGTRLEIPEVAGLVILQTNNFASNSSETRFGQSWVVQRWSLDIYAQHAGTFTIPPISVRLSVNDESTGSVTGELFTPTLQFNADIPEALSRADHWVAAPSFTVRQSFDRDLDELQIGDAIEREIIFEASGVMAMMLPTFTVEEISGLAAYPQPSSLGNNSNRGVTTARRVEHISYVVEDEGEYQLPARDYYWWDTSRGELQLRFLEAVDIRVGRDVASDVKAHSTSRWLQISPRKLMLYTATLIFVIALAWVLYKRVPTIPWSRIGEPFRQIWRRLNQMRKPALPSHLNPDSSAAE